MQHQHIFEKAYALMDEPIIDGNCGELCGYHCCRHNDANGQKMGMYLLPSEFECMQKNVAKSFEIHSSKQYDIPPRIKKLFYLFCETSHGCLRNMRPIQCRTYPFEPHLENGKLSLVIERYQIHACPLLEQIPSWRKEFIAGIYAGWSELLKIPMIQYYVEMESLERLREENVMKQHNGDTWI